jgi:large subunit ribosomal protein L33
MAESRRTPVSLACTECESRNYRTTRKPDQKGQLVLKKHCPKCKRHTVHKETK